jgi:hypothetical protein
MSADRSTTIPAISADVRLAVTPGEDGCRMDGSVAT